MINKIENGSLKFHDEQLNVLASMIISDNIPRMNDFIIIDNCGYQVKSVTFHYKHIKETSSVTLDINVWVE